MRTSLVYITFLTLILTYVLRFQVHAAPAAPVIKHLSSLLKWTTTRSSSKTPQSDENVLQFEDGYLVETVVEGNELGVMPYSIRVSQDGELYAVDAVNSNIVRITPPLSHYSRARLVAGSFQGYTGHVDGKANDARFNHPKGVTMDDKGNVYVADTSNLAIRKIGEAGVTTIAGGKSNVAGYRDGPSEDAKFSSDFDVIYVRPTCSLLVIDRGNAALRQIALNQEDCDDQNNSISATDVFMVVGAVITGYTICMLQQGFGSSFLSRMQQPMERESQEHPSKGKTTPVVETIKEESEAGWPSFGQLLMDLSKLALEALASVFLQFMPFSFQRKSSTNGLTPLKDSLVMPEDVAEPPLVQKHRIPAPLSETRQAHTPNASDKYSEMKPPKMRSSSFKDPSLSSKHRSSKRQEYAEFYGPNEVTNGLTPLKDSLVMPEDVAEPPLVQKHRTPAPLSETRQAHTPNAGDKYSEMKPPKMRSSSFKDPSLSSKHRSSKRQEYAEFYGPNEVPLPVRSKSQKERTKHRQWDKSGEVGYGVVGAEHKPVEIKPVNFDEAKFGHYNIRSKYADSYRFD